MTRRKPSQRAISILEVAFLLLILAIQFLLMTSDFRTAGHVASRLVASNSDEEDLLWFAQITDVHIGKTAARPIALKTFLSLLNEAVNPAFVINTGDLVEGDYRAVEPDLSEWITYDSTISEIVDELNFPYYDLPGNHDNLDNNNLTLYKQYSHLGKTYGTIHASWRIEKGNKTAQFVGISTVDVISGESQISYEGLITESELAYLRAALEQPADIKIVFGHHSPVETEWGYHIKGTPEKEALLELLQTSEVVLYANGHRHKERIVINDGTVFATCDNWPYFRLAAVDLKRGQTSFFRYSANPLTWPLILPVFPINQSQVVQPQGDLSQEIPFEVLVFSRSAVSSVSVDAGNGDWVDLRNAGTYIWKLPENEHLEASNDTIKFKATDQFGRRREISLTIERKGAMNSKTDKAAIDLFTTIFAVVLATLPIYVLRRKANK
ncbi:MAG: metallophosphoesterase family protein [Candidatus Thorarchaeota archaeon]